MKNRLAFLFLLVSAVCGVASLRMNADTCTCSCCDGLGDSIVSNILNASCSSNCVRMTPEECVSMTNSIFVSLDSISENASNVANYASSAYNSLANAVESIGEIRTLTQQAISSLATTNNTIYENLFQIRGIAQGMTNLYGTVETPVSSMTYSNNTSGASIFITGPQRVSTYGRRILNYVTHAIDSLSTFEGNVQAASDSVRSVLNDCLSYLDSVSNGVDGDLDSAILSVGEVQNGTFVIQDEVFLLRPIVASVRCDSCGSGSGSNGDDSGGTTDFAPILAAIQSLQDRLDYWMNRLFNLINNYYTDYNSARLTPLSGLVDFDDYSDSQNWFHRVEMLLYSMSSIGEENTEEIPESPDASTTYDTTKQQMNTGLDTDKQDYTSKITSSFADFKESLGDLLDHLSVFGVQASDNLGGMLILASETYGWELRMPQDYYSSLWYKFRVGFRVMWCLLTLSLYLLLLIVYCKFMVNVAGAFIGWVNDSMG